tara:strand:- start:51 stop:746 length:696 start_codon:yes stop_codon:yes gene_type:complete
MKQELDSKELMYSQGKNDECYTPDYGVEPILEFIPKEKIIWCPFDTKESEFVKQISKSNPVVHSHINDGKDFFDYEPDEWDIIISNPPFTNKRKYFERALSFNKPFALIMTNTWLNDSAPVQLFHEKDLQLLMFDMRMKFASPDNRDNNKITFSSSYYCWNFLPKQIVMKKIKAEVNQREKDKYNLTMSRKQEQKAFKKSIPGYVMSESEWELATDDYKHLRKGKTVEDFT